MFNKDLESLRGLAALMVAIGHSLIVLSVDGINTIWVAGIHDLNGVQSTITRFLLLAFNGGAAVTIFFVLSGYVLGLSLDKSQPSIANSASFYIKRLFRIYPAHLSCLLVVITSISIFHTYQIFDSSSVWYTWWYNSKITFDLAVSNIFLFSNRLNPVTWTLQVELVMSFIIPFAHLLSRKLPPMTNLFVTTVLIILAYYNINNLYIANGYIFFIALMIPSFIGRLDSILTSRYGIMLFFMSVVALCSSRFLLGPEYKFLYSLIQSLASVFIVSYIVCKNTKMSILNKLLGSRSIRMLGKISFSFYLFHFIILYWISYVMFLLIDDTLLSKTPLFIGIVLASISVFIAIHISKIIYAFVEKPMIKLGKEFSGFVGNRIIFFQNGLMKTE